MGFTLDDYQIGWISALPIEGLLAEIMLDEAHDALPLPPNDENVYSFGQVKLNGKSGAHNVIIAQLPQGEVGKASAATVAKDMLRTFPNLKFGLMVGLAGGVWSPEVDVRLGDIVVGAPDNNEPGIVQYDHGKAIQDQDFVRKGFMNKAPKLLRTAVGVVQRNHMRKRLAYLSNLELDEVKEHAPRPIEDNLYRPTYVHQSKGSCAGCSIDQLQTRPLRPHAIPKVHYGTIASGDRVIRDALLAEKIRRQYGILCFEMEAAGLDAFPCLVIRGISDYADTHKNDDWHAYAAASAAAYAKELLTFIPPTAVKALPAIGNKHWIMPRRSAPLFTGRTALIQRMRAHLLPDSASPEDLQQHRTFVLHGIGGAGKSEAAIRFCEHYREMFWGVFWIDADTTQSVEQGFAKIAEICSLPDKSLSFVRNWLANTTTSWLLVLDNCDDFKMDFWSYLPTNQRGCVIVTTRLSECQGFGVSETLDDLEYEDSILLLLKACKIKENDWQDQRTYAVEVIELLGQHALALVHAGAYISNGYSTLQQYPSIFKKQQQRLMGYEPYQLRSRHKSVYATFEASAEALRLAGDEESSLALHLLQVLAFLHREHVDESIFVRAYKECRFMEGYIDSDDDDSSDDRTAESSNIDEPFDDTVHWSDIDAGDVNETSPTSGDRKSRSVHTSHIPVGSNGLQGEKIQGVIDSALDMDVGSCPSQSTCSNSSCISRCVSPDGVGEMDDGNSTQDGAEQDDDFDPDYDFGIDRLRSWHCEQAYGTGLIDQDTPEGFRKARARLLQLSLVRVDGERGAISIHPLVHEWARLRMVVEVRQHAWERAACVLALSSQPSIGSPISFIHGFAPHPVACFRLWPQLTQESHISMNTGRILYTFSYALDWVGGGYLAEIARRLSDRLELKSNSEFYDLHLIKVLEGICLLEAGENIKAVSLFKSLDESQEKLLPFRNKELKTLNTDLKNAYLKNGRFRRKPSCFQEFVQRRVLQSIDMLTGMSWKEHLALAYSHSGDIQKEIDLYEKIAKLQAWLFPTHKKQLDVQNELARAYLNVGKNWEAVELLEEVVKIQESTLHREHQDRLGSQHLLARAYLKVDKNWEAIELLEEVVKIEESTLHREHPHRLTSRHALAAAYLKVDKNWEAIELLEEVVKIEESTLHREHLHRLTSRHELAAAYLKVDKNWEAIELLEEVVKIEQETLSTRDRTRLVSMTWLADAYVRNHENQKAVTLLEEVVAVKRKTLADEDEERLISVKRLAAALYNLGEFGRAESLIEEVVEIRRRTLGVDHENFIWSQELLDDIRGAMRRDDTAADSENDREDESDYESDLEYDYGRREHESEEEDSEGHIATQSTGSDEREDEPDHDDIEDEPNDRNTSELENNTNIKCSQETPPAQQLFYRVAGRLTAQAALMF